jgi:ribonuclease E
MTGKARVHELARELGITSKELLAKLQELGESIKSPAAMVEADVADRIRAEYPVPETETTEPQAVDSEPAAGAGEAETAPVGRSSRRRPPPPVVVFTAPAEAPAEAPAPRRAKREPVEPEAGDVDITVAEDVEDLTAEPEDVREAAIEQAQGARRRRRRGRRGRGGRPGTGGAEAGEESDEDDETGAAEDLEAETEDESAEGEAGDEEGEEAGGESKSTRRRRRRRRAGTGAGAEGSEDDPADTVVHVRQSRPAGTDDDGVRAVKGSTRLEAKRQRRRDGRDTNRRRPPILTEAEFLARREAVDRVMAVRQTGDRTQIAVLEDDVLVEHYVTRATSTSYVGNIYLGRVQNVLPSMEAAFIDIGKGRNGVLYAGEVNWDAVGLEGKARAIENALNSGDTVLVQVTKDPIGHKGARLTSQISLPGRFLVYVPGGAMTGISRKLPDTERHRLKAILKKVVPEDAGVIIRTAAEGASEEEITRDVERLQAQWETIQTKSANTKAAPTLVHGEPDLAIRVVRDVFNEDFKKLVVQGGQAWDTVSEYVTGVAPDLAERVHKHTGESDLFADLRVDEQLMKGLDRKVWLPSGGSLVIDRTEAMTVVDVNTGKFVGSGGNLEQTVTRNNLEAAEEIVRQLRLRDIGGIIVVDFIDMVLESNRELVLRRLTECLGRDRTKHQVAEVTSLGLVQMTRKRIGEGLLEAFSETCEACKGRGVIVHAEPVNRVASSSSAAEEDRPKSQQKRRRGGGNGGGNGGGSGSGRAAEADVQAIPDEQRKAAQAAMAAIHKAAHHEGEDGESELIDVELPFAHDAAAELEMEAVATVIDAATIDPEGDEVDFGGPVAVSEDDQHGIDERDAQAEVWVARETPAVVEIVSVEPVGVEVAEIEPDGMEEAEFGVAEVEVAEPATGPGPQRRQRRGASRPAGPPSMVNG